MASMSEIRSPSGPIRLTRWAVPLWIDDGAEVDAGRGEPRPHPCARVVLAETGVPT